MKRDKFSMSRVLKLMRTDRNISLTMIVSAAILISLGMVYMLILDKRSPSVFYGMFLGYFPVYSTSLINRLISQKQYEFRLTLPATQLEKFIATKLEIVAIAYIFVVMELFVNYIFSIETRYIMRLFGDMLMVITFTEIISLKLMFEKVPKKSIVELKFFSIIFYCFILGLLSGIYSYFLTSSLNNSTKYIAIWIWFAFTLVIFYWDWRKFKTLKYRLYGTSKKRLDSEK